MPFLIKPFSKGPRDPDLPALATCPFLLYRNGEVVNWHVFLRAALDRNLISCFVGPNIYGILLDAPYPEGE